MGLNFTDVPSPMASSPAQHCRESFVIVQSDADDEIPEFISTPHFVGGIFTTLAAANCAALALAIEGSNQTTTNTLSNAASNPVPNDAGDESTTLRDVLQEAADTSQPTTTESLPQSVQRTQSADGRWLCKCTVRGWRNSVSSTSSSVSSSSEDNDINSFTDLRKAANTAEEDKTVKLEVRKIQVRKLGTTLAWNFVDGGA